MKKGFTLIEMVVVVFIIALILLLTMPNIQKVINTVQDKGCKSQVKVIDAAILEYMLIHDQKPQSTSELISEGLISSEQVKCQNNKVITIVDGQARAD